MARTDLEVAADPHPIEQPRFPFRRSMALLVAVVLIAWVVIWTVTSLSVLNSQNHNNEAASRADCKTQYNAILQGPVTKRDNLTSQVASLNGDLQSQLGSALLGVEAGLPIQPQVISSYAATQASLEGKRSELAAAIDVVTELPTLNTAANDGFTFANHHYAPCPTA